MNYLILISTIIFFGLLGGLVNAIRSGLDFNNYWKSFIKGIVAAFLVPVFLEIIKSELGRNLTNDLYDYIVFGGMCLIAAIFSDKFIDTVGEKILRKVEEAKRKAEESNIKVNTVIEKRAERDESELPVEKRILNFEEFNLSKNKSNVKDILKTLKNENYEYRTVNGIAKETGLTKITIINILNDLQEKKIVTRIKLDKRTLWTLNK
jgi:hypothetical protein